MLRKKGQNIAEYSIVIALVIAAVMGMQIYIRRGLQAKLRDASNYTGNITVPTATGTAQLFTATQYEASNVTSSANITSARNYTENLTARGGIARNFTVDETQRGAGSWENVTTY